MGKEFTHFCIEDIQIANKLIVIHHYLVEKMQIKTTSYLLGWQKKKKADNISVEENVKKNRTFIHWWEELGKP